VSEVDALASPVHLNWFCPLPTSPPVESETVFEHYTPTLLSISMTYSSQSLSGLGHPRDLIPIGATAVVVGWHLF
jgi:hypothetical protein